MREPFSTLFVSAATPTVPATLSGGKQTVIEVTADNQGATVVGA